MSRIESLNDIESDREEDQVLGIKKYKFNYNECNNCFVNP